MTLSPQTVSLAIGCGGVALLLFLILIARVQPFLALLVVSLGVGLAAGINPADLPKLIETGVGATLGHIALIVALGAIDDAGAVMKSPRSCSASARFSVCPVSLTTAIRQLLGTLVAGVGVGTSGLGPGPGPVPPLAFST